MTRLTNPIAFNAYTMTANQLKEAADTLRTLFDLIERGGTPEDVKNYVEQARDAMLKFWR